MKQNLFILIAIIAVSCSAIKNEPSLIGDWKYSSSGFRQKGDTTWFPEASMNDLRLSFTKDGKVIFSNAAERKTGSFSEFGDKVMLQFEGQDKPDTIFVISLDQSHLVVRDPSYVPILQFKK